jgi:hypothetical protein
MKIACAILCGLVGGLSGLIAGLFGDEMFDGFIYGGFFGSIIGYIFSSFPRSLTDSRMATEAFSPAGFVGAIVGGIVTNASFLGFLISGILGWWIGLLFPVIVMLIMDKRT